MKFTKIAAVALAVSMMTGCAVVEGGNVYDVTELNSVQETATIDILAIQPARVKVDNSENAAKAQKAAAVGGAILGAVLGYNTKHRANGAAVGAVGGGLAGAGAGALVPSERIVEGVTISYKGNSKLLSSTQVGRACEFKQGPAVMILANGKTRIQPNTECPKK